MPVVPKIIEISGFTDEPLAFPVTCEDPLAQAGIVLAGLGNLTNILTDYLNDQVTLQFDADNKIELKSGRINVQSPEVYLGEALFEFIVKGTKMKDWLNNQIKAIFDAHTHDMQCTNYVPNPAIIGTTQPPNSSISSATETDIASDKHKVGD